MKNKKIIYLLSFIIPMLLLMIILFIKGIGFNAEKILVSDMHAQYTTLFLYLKRILSGTESIFYSFNNGLGGSMYATFAYYIASPLNLLIAFFNDNDIPQFIMFLLFIKIGLCGLTMNIYINKHFDLKQNSLIFSCCYALMAYVVNYYFNIMWLDGVYLLPLVLLGIDKLLKENKWTLYVISLFLSIFSNFYIGYMICIFSCIYFIQELILNYEKKEYKKKIFRFLKYSVLSGLLASFLLIPTFTEIMNFSRYLSPLVETDIFESINSFFTSFYIGTHNCKNLLNHYGTFIFCSIFCIMNFMLYFINKNINRKEKIISLTIFIFLFLSSIIPILNYIWHGFSYTNCFSNRFSFIISFYIIFLAIKNYIKFDKKIIKNLIFIVVYFIIGLLLLLNNYTFYDITKLILSVLFIILYYVVIYLVKNIKFKNVIIFVVIIIEILLNMCVCFNYNKSDDVSFKYFKDNFCNNLIYDDNYRLDQDYFYGGLDGLLCGYSGVSSFSSTNNISKYNISYHFGYDTTDIIYVNELQNTPIVDSLLGIKYIYSKNNSIIYLPIDYKNEINYYDDETNKLIDTTYKLHLNDYALKLGFLVENLDVKFENVFEYQNELLKKLSGIDKNSLEKVKASKKSDEKYEINNTDYTFVKIYYNKKDTHQLKLYDIYIDDKKSDFKNNNVFNINGKIMEIKNIDDDIKIEKIEFYKLNKEVFEEQINKLKENQINIIEKNKNILKFNIETKEKKTLLLTLPYEKGWSIYDNGEKITYNKALDGFISIDLEDGIHNIEMIYKPQYFKSSIIISLISILILTYSFIKKN